MLAEAAVADRLGGLASRSRLAAAAASGRLGRGLAEELGELERELAHVLAVREVGLPLVRRGARVADVGCGEVLAVLEEAAECARSPSGRGPRAR